MDGLKAIHLFLFISSVLILMFLPLLAGIKSIVKIPFRFKINYLALPSLKGGILEL